MTIPMGMLYGSDASDIAYVGRATGGYSGLFTTYTVALSGLTGGVASVPAAGDLIVASWVTAAKANITMTCTGPVGLTIHKIADLHSGPNVRSNLGVAWAYISGSVPASLTFNHTGNPANSSAALVNVFRGVDPTVLDVAIATATGIGYPDAPAATPLTDGALALAIMALGSEVTPVVSAAPTGYTAAGTSIQNTVGSRALVSAARKGALASGVAENPDPWTMLVTTDPWCAANVILKPAA